MAGSTSQHVKSYTRENPDVRLALSKSYTVVLFVEEGEEDVSCIPVSEDQTIRLFAWRQVLGETYCSSVSHGEEPLHGSHVRRMEHRHRCL